MFPYERFLGYLCHHIKNRSQVASNGTRFYREMSYLTTARTLNRQLLEQSDAGRELLNWSLSHGQTDIRSNATDRYTYGAVAVKFHGHSKIVTLDGEKFDYLCTTLRSLDLVYGRLYSEFVRSGEVSMDTWNPERELSAAERAVIRGPSMRVRVYSMATLGGVEFRSAEWESARNTRSSYFSFEAVEDKKDGTTTEYGRVLQFWEVTFGQKQMFFAYVDVYQHAGEEVCCPSYPSGGVEFALNRIDTSKPMRGRDRHVLLASQITSQIILGPPDNRLDMSPNERLKGPCIVMVYKQC